MSVITVGGPTGGGSRLLGPLVAQILGADYVDRLILTDAARHIGATVEALHQLEERPLTRAERLSGMLQRILERSASTVGGADPYFGSNPVAFLTEEYDELPQPTITSGHEVEDQKYIDAIRKVITDLANEGNVVIVGRAGSIMQKDNPKVLRLGIIARLEDRIYRIMERDNIDRELAEITINNRDRARTESFKRYFGIDNPDDPQFYHLVINTSDVNLDYAAQIVVQACENLNDGTLLLQSGAGK